MNSQQSNRGDKTLRRIHLSKEERAKEIEQLGGRLSELKAQREAVDAEARNRADKRDALNERVRKARQEASSLKIERDTLNEQVQNLKLQRTAIRGKIYDKIEEIRRLRPRGEELAELRPSRSRASLQEQVESIDWEIQTSILTKDEEKELVDQVRLLESQLSFHRKFDNLVQKIRALQDDVRTIDAQGKAFHEKLMGTAQKSQTTHQKMLEKIAEAKRLKAEADSFHQVFVEERAKSKALRSEIAELTKRLRVLLGEISEEEAQERRRSEESLHQKVEGEAKEKLRRGDKLTLDEFKLLAGGDDEEGKDQS